MTNWMQWSVRSSFVKKYMAVFLHCFDRIVVHGRIDGFSHLIVYLCAATNNHASTVIKGFCRQSIPMEYHLV